MSSSAYRKILIKYIPENSVENTIELILNHNIYLKITKHRTTKLGDFIPDIRNNINNVTVNHSLNKYFFLIVLYHEIAHAIAFRHSYPRRVKPHGYEWKQTYKKILVPLINPNIFPEEILVSLLKHMKNPKASTYSDVELTKLLLKYNNNPSKSDIESIPLGSTFKINNGKIFRKGEKQRKRYRCTEVNSNRVYLISPLAEIFPVSE